MAVCDYKRAKCDDNCKCRVLSMECTDISKRAGNFRNIVLKSESDSELDNGNNQNDVGVILNVFCFILFFLFICWHKQILY